MMSSMAVSLTTFNVSLLWIPGNEELEIRMKPIMAGKVNIQAIVVIDIVLFSCCCCRCWAYVELSTGILKMT